MDGFELHVHERRLHQYGQIFLLSMQKLSEDIQAFRHLLRWRRNKCCVPGPCASDPVLAFTEFTRTLLTSAPLGQENLVNFSYQPQRERKIPPGGGEVRDSSRPHNLKLPERLPAGHWGLRRSRIASGQKTTTVCPRSAKRARLPSERRGK